MFLYSRAVKQPTAWPHAACKGILSFLQICKKTKNLVEKTSRKAFT
jgi:hypothetical protein